MREQHRISGAADAWAAQREARRQRIVAEIRRIAAENGGAAPGKQQFLRRTGIRHSAWWGAIWPRWSDALKEAGFAPNRSTPRFDDEDMLAAIAGVAQTLGRIPSWAELVGHRSSGRWMPHHQAYMSHFGSKPELLRHLKRWAEANPERADIEAMLAGVADEPEPDRRVVGAVYMLRAGRSYKIGCSRAPQQRVHDLQQALPEKANLVHAIDTDDPHGIEAYWHRRFAEKRLRGEWFRLTAEDVAAFRRRRYQ